MSKQKYKLDLGITTNKMQELMNERASLGWKLFQLHWGGLSGTHHIIWAKEPLP